MTAGDDAEAEWRLDQAEARANAELLMWHAVLLVSLQRLIALYLPILFG